MMRRSAKTRASYSHSRDLKTGDAPLEAWLTFEDLANSLQDVYLSAIAQGSGREAGIARAAALISIYRDQFASPSVSLGLARLILDSEEAPSRHCAE